VAHQQADRVPIDLTDPGRMDAQRLQFGPEQQRGAGHPVVHRLLTQAVPGQLKRALLPVPEGQRKHAVAALEGGLEPPADDGSQKDLRVGMPAPGAACVGLLKLATQCPVVVDFAVEHQHEASAGRQHRLMTFGAQIED
jgi:hypothetical protein